MTSRLVKYVGLAVPYGSAVCLIYLFAYWGSFDVNVLEYVELPDIARLSLHPVLASLSFLLLGALIGQVLAGDRLPPGGGAQSRMSKLVTKHWRSFVALYIFGIGILIALGPEPRKWILVATLVSFMSIPLTHASLAIDLFPDPRIRSAALYLLLWVPGMAFAFGRLDADSIQSARSARTVDVSRSGVDLRFDASHPVFYVGHIGDRFALYESMSRQIVLVQEDAITSLVLRTHMVNKPYMDSPRK